MFKVDWEKTSVTYQLPEGMVAAMVQGAYPEKNPPHFLEDELISTLKFSWKTKILLENEKHPLIFEAYAHIQFWPDQRAVIR